MLSTGSGKAVKRMERKRSRHITAVTIGEADLIGTLRLSQHLCCLFSGADVRLLSRQDAQAGVFKAS